MIFVAASIALNASPGFSSCDDVITYVDMHKSTRDSSLINRAPERNPLELSCYVISNLNTICISASRSISAEIEIGNLSAGSNDFYFSELSISPLSLPLRDTGHYFVSVTLPNGSNYYGEFDL